MLGKVIFHKQVDSVSYFLPNALKNAGLCSTVYSDSPDSIALNQEISSNTKDSGAIFHLTRFRKI